jgi:hypothetical protein
VQPRTWWLWLRGRAWRQLTVAACSYNPVGAARWYKCPNLLGNCTGFTSGIKVASGENYSFHIITDVDFLNYI